MFAAHRYEQFKMWVRHHPQVEKFIESAFCSGSLSQVLQSPMADSTYKSIFYRQGIFNRGKFAADQPNHTDGNGLLPHDHGGLADTSGRELHAQPETKHVRDMEGSQHVKNLENEVRAHDLAASASGVDCGKSER